MIASESYNELIDEFGKDKIESRYVFLADIIRTFIAREKLEEQVCLSPLVLEQVVLDYFADISRLKKFHSIVRVNQDKITAYTLQWILRRKPIQLMKAAGEPAKFVNERFVLSYLQMFLFGENFSALVVPERLYEHEHFFRTFFYTTKYRYVDAQILELLIATYRAGRAFQYSVDVSQMEESAPLLQEEEITLKPEDGYE